MNTLTKSLIALVLVGGSSIASANEHNAQEFLTASISEQQQSVKASIERQLQVELKIETEGFKSTVNEYSHWLAVNRNAPKRSYPEYVELGSE